MTDSEQCVRLLHTVLWFDARESTVTVSPREPGRPPAVTLKLADFEAGVLSLLPTQPPKESPP